MRRTSEIKIFDNGEQRQEKKTQSQRCFRLGRRGATYRVHSISITLTLSSQETSAEEGSEDGEASSEEDVPDEDEESSDDEDDIIQKGTESIFESLTSRTRRHRL